jgi:hypothetical protein
MFVLVQSDGYDNSRDHDGHGPELGHGWVLVHDAPHASHALLRSPSCTHECVYASHSIVWSLHGNGNFRNIAIRHGSRHSYIMVMEIKILHADEASHMFISIDMGS